MTISRLWCPDGRILKRSAKLLSRLTPDSPGTGNGPGFSGEGRLTQAK